MSPARELTMLIPGAPPPNWPPEHACSVMEAELEALSSDIQAVRERARRIAAGGLDLRPQPGPPSLTGERVTLAGGRSVVIRPIEPRDAPELARAFARLGALARFRRFLVRLNHLSERQIWFLTRVDHTSHEALIAFDAATGEGVGVARYLCDARDPRSARFALVVVDALQGRGLGTALLDRLTARAQANGVELLEGSTVAGNEAARHLGCPTTVDARTGTLHLTITPGGVPRSPAERLQLRARVSARHSGQCRTRCAVS